MSDFSEEVFIWSLTQRSEDCKIFAGLFNPAWLQSPEYRPILLGVYEFTKKYGMPPSFSALRKYIEEKDPAIYRSRYSKAIDNIEGITPKPELSDMVMTIDKAKEVAISWSFKEMISSPGFIDLNKQNRGYDQMVLINSWMKQFQGSTEELEMNIQEAVKYLTTQKGWETKDVSISSGIPVIDRMLGGGLRPKNLGIILAPTGGGKSFCLTVMARKMTTVEDKNVLFITNELSMEETTERFISSLTSTNLEDLTSDLEYTTPPDIKTQAIQLSKHWAYGLQNKLRIWEVRREISTDEIDAMLSKLKGLYGWKPDVIIVDYMERMKPTVTGIRRDQSWNWYGAIAKDLCRLAKMQDALVWTAGQLNRSGQSVKNEVDLTAASGSIQHLYEAAAVFIVRIQEHPDGRGGQTMMIQSEKIRHYKRKSKAVYVEVDVGKMIITDTEVKIVTHNIENKKKKHKGEEDE